jgi:hypothetical protein
MVAQLLALGGSLLGGAMGANAAGKASDQLYKGSQNAFALQQTANNANQPYLTRGNQAGDYLQELMGLGSNDSYESLANQYVDQFTTYSKNKKSGGGLKGAIKGAMKASIGGSLLGGAGIGNTMLGALAGSKSSKKYTARIDQAGLDAFVKQKWQSKKPSEKVLSLAL